MLTFIPKLLLVQHSAIALIGNVRDPDVADAEAAVTLVVCIFDQVVPNRFVELLRKGTCMACNDRYVAWPMLVIMGSVLFHGEMENVLLRDGQGFGVVADVLARDNVLLHREMAGRHVPEVV